MSREKVFENHIANYLKNVNGYIDLSSIQIQIDKDFHFISEHLFQFLETTQKELLDELNQIYGIGYREEILRSLKQEAQKKELWFIIRHGLVVKGKKIHLYIPKQRAFSKYRYHLINT